MAKVLIIGASRGIGLETVKAALRAGHRVRALARSAARMPIQDANLDPVSGDARAGEMRGHGRIIYASVVFPLLLKRVYDDKDVQEWIIRSSGLDWTIVRPGLLTNQPPTGRYRILTAAKDWRFGLISRADVADFIVRQI